MNKISSVFLLLIVFGQLKAQNNDSFYRKDTLDIQNYLELELEHYYTSYYIHSLDNEISKLTVQAAHTVNTFLSSKNSNLNEHPSGFYIPDSCFNKLSISSDKACRFIVELFYAPCKKISTLQTLNKLDDCVQPTAIEQSVWRDGLPDPVSGRQETDVAHVIIHHSASSNAAMDFTTVVRNIYLFHTQSNGWDDIGYNYLIAPNGDIYKGRDDLNVADEDNIQGAHFCAKNGGTMGVCLLGTYSDLAPSDTMMKSLADLIAWKLHKEQITAYDSFIHPTGSSALLGSIALHRNGCSTECPGDSVALRIEHIKSSVQNQLDACEPVANTTTALQSAIKVYPNPASETIHIQGTAFNTQYAIINSLGQVIEEGILNSNNSLISISKPGIYNLVLTKDLKRSVIPVLILGKL